MAMFHKNIPNRTKCSAHSGRTGQDLAASNNGIFPIENESASFTLMKEALGSS
jgi:hypothetical protein